MMRTITQTLQGAMLGASALSLYECSKRIQSSSLSLYSCCGLKSHGLQIHIASMLLINASHWPGLCKSQYTDANCPWQSHMHCHGQPAYLTWSRLPRMRPECMISVSSSLPVLGFFSTCKQTCSHIQSS